MQLLSIYCDFALQRSLYRYYDVQVLHLCDDNSNNIRKALSIKALNSLDCNNSTLLGLTQPPSFANPFTTPQ